MDQEPRRIANRYRVISKLGSGGMGIVWRALDEVLERTVAVKELRFPPAITADERAGLSARALSEARNAARLHHPNIVAVHDVISGDDGLPCIVMQLVEGHTLDGAVEAHGPLSPTRTAEVGLALLDALECAHAASVVHRDVKPSNVLIGADGTILLSDFSIAQALDVAGLTKTGILVGSPGYVSPERVNTGRSGPPADLFGLGATLYYAVEGTGPFHRDDSVAALFAAATQPHPRPALAGPLEPVLDGLLTKDPGKRWTIEQTRAALKRILATSVNATPEATSPLPGEVSLAGPSAVAKTAVATASERPPAPTFAVGSAPPPRRASITPGLSPTSPQPAPTRRPRRRGLVWIVAAAATAVLVAATLVAVFSLRPTPDGDNANATAPGPSRTPSVTGTGFEPAGTILVRPGKTLRFGVMTPESGEQAALGLALRNAVEFAVADIRTIKGFPIEMVAFDDRCEAAGGDNAAKAITADASLMAVVGPVCTKAARPALPLFEAADIAIISGAATGTDLPSLARNTFNRTVLDDGQLSGRNPDYVNALASVQDFYSRYSDRFGSLPAPAYRPFTAYTYDAAAILFGAIERASVIRPDGTFAIITTQLGQALRATSGYHGITGTITLDAQGNRVP